MSRARQLADFIGKPLPETYEKNLIKNGAMQISQRGYQDGDWSTSDVKPEFDAEESLTRSRYSYDMMN